MTEENTTPDAAAPKKKPAAKRASSKASGKTPNKTRASAAKKPAARKASPAKAAPQPDTTGSPQTEAAPTAADRTADSQERTGAPEQASVANDTHEHKASKMVEDLKGRDWPKIIQRALLMVFFGFLAWITISVAFFLATAQVVISIFVGEPNKDLTRLIKQGSSYIGDVLDYMSFATDECPFPFGKNLPEAD